MKKILFAVLLICLCIVVSACTATDPDNLFETEPDNTVATTQENQGDTTGSLPEDTQSDVVDIMYYTGKYQYGNMQKNMPSGEFMLYGNEVVFVNIQNGKSVMMSYDLLSGEVLPFCKDATCTHETCVAAVFCNLEVYKGKLFATITTENGSWQAVEINGNVQDKFLDANINLFFHHEDKMYFTTRDHSLMVLEEGQKEPQIVLEEHTGFWQTIWENYLYATNWDYSIVRVDLTAENPKEEVLVTNAWGITDGEYIYYADLKNYKLFRCDMDGNNPQLIEERKVHPGSTNFDDEYFYYCLYIDRKSDGTPDSCDIYRFPKEDPTQIEKIVTLPNPVWQVFTVPGTDKIFVTTYTNEREEGPIYVIGTDGSNPTMLEIPEY